MLQVKLVDHFDSQLKGFDCLRPLHAAMKVLLVAFNKFIV